MNTPAPGPQACLVGGGIASLAAAVYLLRDGHFPGASIRILEEESLGGSLDAAGTAEPGFSMRGSRMYGAAYELMYELLSHIPSLDDPDKSVTQDTLEFWVEAPWHDKARLVEHGRIVDAAAFGLAQQGSCRPHRVHAARRGGARRQAHRRMLRRDFFATHFWFMWRSMFGFETWHSAAELRRYLLRFLRLFPDLPTLKIIQSTRYNGHDSIVRPIVRWLEQQGVQFDLGVQVTDLDFEPSPTAARRCDASAPGATAQRRPRGGARRFRHRDAGLDDGRFDPRLDELAAAAAPAPQRRLAVVGAARSTEPAFGRPAVFCGDVERTQWVTFTVTARR